MSEQSEHLRAIADAIREREGSSDPIPANTFAQRILDLPGGGSGAGQAPDPVEVYNSTRPADWLPMPEPRDDEMYLLVHVPDGASALLAFTVTCAGSYTVELGTVASGVFSSFGSASVASGEKYETRLSAADYDSLTAGGVKQVMVKVSGTDILTWEPSIHSGKGTPANFSAWNIAEISCCLPKGTAVVCGSNTANRALKHLKYFSWKGQNVAEDMSYLFANCYGLVAVLELDTSSTKNLSNMFRMCNALIALPEINTSGVTDMGSLFYGCYSLPGIPELDMSAVKSMGSMFYYCYALVAVPALNTSAAADMSSLFYGCCSLADVAALDTSAATDISRMFYGCKSLARLPELDTHLVKNMGNVFNGCNALIAVPKLNTSAVTSISSIFSGCYSLASVRFDPDVAGWAGYAISFADCSLGHDALVALFDSLPVITTSKALTLTGNPGVSQLTEEEKAIATNKKWTLTM